MSNLAETNEWVEGIYEFATDDWVEGGPDGVDNLPHKQLAARTQFLKTKVEKLREDVDELTEESGTLSTHKAAAVLDHPDYSVTSFKIADNAVIDRTIGNRTVNQALASPANAGTLTQLLSWLSGRIKAITGATNWYDAPAATLAQLWALFGTSGHSHNGTAGQGPKIAYGNLSSVPSTFTPSSHTHDDRYYTETEVNNLLADAMADAIAISIPVGTVIHVAQNTPPSGYLKANGAAVSRTTYATLYAAIGTTFGAGNGSTTFNLPDLRGEFIRGWDDGRGVDAGRVFGSAQGDAIRNITGTIVGNNRGNFLTATGCLTVSYNPGSRASLTADAGAFSSMAFDASLVVPTAEENRPRNVALLACIKY